MAGGKTIPKLDLATIFKNWYLPVGDPISEKAYKIPIESFINAITGKAPVETYPDMAAMLANDNLAYRYFAFVSNAVAYTNYVGWALFLYMGPDASSIGNYVFLLSEEFLTVPPGGGSDNWRGALDGTTWATPTNGSGVGGAIKGGNTWYLTEEMTVDPDGQGDQTFPPNTLAIAKYDGATNPLDFRFV